MTKVTLLEQLRAFTQASTEDMRLPTVLQQDEDAQAYRAPEVYCARLPDSRAAKKKAPYILHQIITGKDAFPAGKHPQSAAVVRTIFCVYHGDEQEGGLLLLGLMERLRIALLEQVVIGRQFILDLGEGLETLVYPDDTAPYFMGEMSSVWKLPTIERKIAHGKDAIQFYGGGYPPDLRGRVRQDPET